MASDMSPLGQDCIECNKPAIVVCNGCKDAPSRIINRACERVPYCSTQCQKGHFPGHATICVAARQRKYLLRAAETAQKLLYHVREQLWTAPIVKVDKIDNSKILVHEEPFNTFKSRPLLADIVKTHADRHAILANMTCRTTLVYTNCLLQKMLHNTAYLRELDVCPASPKLSIRVRRTNAHLTKEPDLDNTHYYHSIIRATVTETGERYILDLSGAQYGFPQPVCDYESYAQERMRSIEADRPFGTYRRTNTYLNRRTAASTATTTLLATESERGKGAEKTFNESVAELIDQSITEWESARGMKLSKLIRCNEADFIHQRDHLLNKIHERIASNEERLWRAADWQREYMRMRFGTESSL